MKKAIIIMSLVALIIQARAQNGAPYQKFDPVISALSESLKSNDYRHIEPFIHQDFTYQTYGGDMGTMIMKQVVEGYTSKVEKIDITKLTENEKGFELETVFRSAGEEENHILMVSKDMKLLKADIAKIQMGAHPSSEEKAPEQNYLIDNRPDYVEIPLKLEERDISVEATVNGKKGTFYFDTGAPTLVINTAAFEEGELINRGPMNHDLGGATGGISNVSRLEIEEFSLSQLRGNNVKAIGYDISHLAEGNLGMIGADIMNGYLTFFDLKSQKLKMSKLDDQGKIKDPSLLKGFEPIEVELYGHLPIVRIEIQGQKLNMLLDCGCSSVMIDPKYKDQLIGGCDFVEIGTLKGGGKAEIEVEIYNIQELSFANNPYRNVRAMFQEGVASQHGDTVIDGIIGWDIFYHSIVAYNLENSMIYVKRN